MVGLTEKLLEILELRKCDFSGADIKLLVESIAISESMSLEHSNKDQIELYNKIGKEYLYGGE